MEEFLEDDFAVGLDLGTTYSCIGVYKNGTVEIIPNRIGERTTPSIVTILDKEMKVGEDALNSLVKDYDKSIFEIKRFIGRKSEDKEVEEDTSNLPFKMNLKGEYPKVEIIRDKELKEYSPEEISSFIIKKMIQNAEFYLNKKIKRAIITVPAYFNDAQRNLTMQAAQLVGLDVVRVLNEPTAAAVAYGFGLKNERSSKKNILIFDLGGGTYDVSLLNLENELSIEKNEIKIFDVKSKSGNTHLGGEDFDNVLVDYCLDKFCNNMKESKDEIRSDQKAMKKLKISCENIKRQLSKAEESLLCIDNFFNKKDIILKIKRTEFEEKCKHLIKELQLPLDIALKDAKLNPSDINEVILVGGSTRIPKVKEFLSNYFTGAKINDTINPDEAVAYGATLCAAKILLKKDIYVSGINLLDIIPLSLGTNVINKSNVKEIKERGDEMSIIIKKGTRMPCNASSFYVTCSDNQESVLVDIYEGENQYVKDNHFLGKIVLENLPPMPAGKVSISVNYNIDVNGIFTATAEERSKGIKEIKIINDKTGLSEEEIKRLKDKNKKDYEKQSKIIDILKSYQEERKILQDYKDAYEKEENEEEKYSIITNFNHSLEDFIGKFDQNFDNETIIEKYYIYIRELFESYAKTLNMKEQLEKSDKDEIIKKIKEYFDIFKNRSFGYLNNLLEVLKQAQRKVFDVIVIYCVELMEKSGIEYLQSMKEFSKYHSTLYFEQALLLIKLYIPDETKLKISLKADEIKKFNDIKNICISKLNEVSNGAFLLIKEKKSKNTGYTSFCNSIKIEEGDTNENYEIKLSAFEKLLSQIQSEKDRKKEEYEAICIFNIIKISHKFLGYNQYGRYMKLAEDCEFIVSNLEHPVDKKWYDEFKELYENLKMEFENKKEYGDYIFEDYKKKYPQKFEEIENYYKKEPIDFISFALKNYPYNGYKEDKENKKFDFTKSSKELLDYLCRKYCPYNYEINRGDEEIKLRYAIISAICAKMTVLYSQVNN